MDSLKTHLNKVVDYWFETPNDYQKWFFEGKKLDGYLKTTFSDLLVTVKKTNTLDINLLNSREKLGLIVLLDQFSRHIYRNTPDAFSSDPISLQISKQLLDSSEINKLSATEQLFAVMPLQHSENILDKDTLLEFAKNQLTTCDKKDANSYKSLILHTNGHRGVLEKFGRYPKRNIALARRSTEAEFLYLEENPNGAY